ncbi:DgyrCDS9371 [Dimorphilus gyrociliatus]|uniref:RCR-type E3 ubiquitin transferase n=1 Tax=Dimorphilus gyrociliatus TaxID=2664684 RepID=A0A7I8W210_9ANNE|nr:DgyrCDS9371 [Dimorphilus gyrociliatus]
MASYDANFSAAGSKLNRTLLNSQQLSEAFMNVFLEKLSSRSASKPKQNDSRQGNVQAQNQKKTPKESDIPGVVENYLVVNSASSSFCVYAFIRYSVLGCKLQSNTSILSNTHQCNDGRISINQSSSIRETTSPKLPMIIELGLREILIIITELRSTNPALCKRTLEALFNILSNRTPESMRSEPFSIMENLFEVLLDLTSNSDKSNDDSNSLSALASSCLFALVLCWGETGYILSAISSILMSTSPEKKMKLPEVAVIMRNSVLAYLTQKHQLPDWFRYGVPKSCMVYKKIIYRLTSAEHCAVSSDGVFLYIFSPNFGAYKIGTGCSGTIEGWIYASNTIYISEKMMGWIGAFEKFVLLQPNRNKRRIKVLCKNTLTVLSKVDMSLVTNEGLFFSDSFCVGQISSLKNGDFIVRKYIIKATGEDSVVLVPDETKELKLKLTIQGLHVCGNFCEEGDSEGVIRPVANVASHGSIKNDILDVQCGKDFLLALTSAGNVYFIGNPNSVGAKAHSGAIATTWTLLPLPKEATGLKSLSVGNDGNYALISCQNGTVVYIGIAKRGEDGDNSYRYYRRGCFTYKNLKPRIIKGLLEGECIVSVQANNGISAFITDEGKLILLGREASDHTSRFGTVSIFKDKNISQVALGKAHTIVLSSDGSVYSFGYNHKGQCGRKINRQNIKSESGCSVIKKQERVSLGPNEVRICDDGEHNFVTGDCMICTLCGNCTEYGMFCVLTGNSKHVPGSKCGCGTGDAGCADCGLCRICVNDVLRTEEEGEVFVENRSRSHRKAGPYHRSKDINDRDRRGFQKASENRLLSAPFGASNIEMEYTKTIIVHPDIISIDTKVKQVACGLYHSGLLLETKEVMTFGGNSMGQLGLGDLINRDTPTKARLQSEISYLSTGNNHTALLSVNGCIYTAGSNSKGQLGRKLNSDKKYSTEFQKIPGIGDNNNTKATRIKASSDATFLQIEESLINCEVLMHCEVFATNTSIGIIPPIYEDQCMMMVKKSSGRCRIFRGEHQLNLANSTICGDPVYDVLYTYNWKNKILCQLNSLLSDDICNETNYSLLNSLTCPERLLSFKSESTVNEHNVALLILACIDITSRRSDSPSINDSPIEFHDGVKNVTRYSKEDYNVVDRFDHHGVGWGYSNNAVEAIRFMADRDILLGGFGLFGGRGEYLARIKLIELGMDGGENEINGEILATGNFLYECSPRSKFPALFEEPVLCTAGCWYVAVASISGPSSDCGSCGYSSVKINEQVPINFKFKNSKKSNNGTDVNSGQIPQIFYKLYSNSNSCNVVKVSSFDRLVTPEIYGNNQASTIASGDLVSIVSSNIATLTSDLCIESLLKLLQWSWAAFCCKAPEIATISGIGYLEGEAELRKLVFIASSSIRLLSKYVQKNSNKTSALSDAGRILRRILTESTARVKWLPFGVDGSLGPLKLLTSLLDHCHDAWVQCFSSFFPTPQRMWHCLCELLGSFDSRQGESGLGNSILLSAVFKALCEGPVRLTSIFPFYGGCDTPDIQQSLWQSDSSTSQQEALNLSDYGQHARSPPDLMISSYCYSFKEVLDRILSIASYPVVCLLKQESCTLPDSLIVNACSLLQCLMSDFVISANALQDEETGVNPKTHPVLISPSRFTRTSITSYWSTGNGNAEAICFAVDRSGICIAGACVYGGGSSNNGGSQQFEYELELLEDVDPGAGDKWQLIAYSTGSFTNDDCINDIFQIRFDKIVLIKENFKYALRFRNRGPRTVHGDQGVTQVRCPDNTIFSFSACPLSSNGTNHIRGQIPQILYCISSNESDSRMQSSKLIAEHSAKRDVMNICLAVITLAKSLLSKAQILTDINHFKKLASLHFFNSLMPVILAHIGPIAMNDIHNAVFLLNAMKCFLPVVVDLNKRRTSLVNGNLQESPNKNRVAGPTDTSNPYKCSTIVESSHPYKPASINHYTVKFESSIKWMSVEFDEECSTAQPEDILRIFIPPKKDNSQPVEVGQFSSENGFPRVALLFPGNELWFCLNSVSEKAKSDQSDYYGFKCVVMGYDCCKENGLAQLENECCYLSSLCASSLLSRQLVLPPSTIGEHDTDMKNIEEQGSMTFTEQWKLLRGGLSLPRLPTAQQAIEGILPASQPSNENDFLQDFVSCTAGTSGGRLADWLQSERRIDPSKCSIIVVGSNLRYNVPATLKVITNDQYGQRVLKYEVKVDIEVLPVGNSVKSRPIGLSEPELHIQRPHYVPFKPIFCITSRNVVYHSISMMKEYDDYSFEELRYLLPEDTTNSGDTLRVKKVIDGLYTCQWIPPTPGCYELKLMIDNKSNGEVLRVTVEDSPGNHIVFVNPPKQIRKPCIRGRIFTEKCSAGLRIRSQPSLQAEQIGIVKPAGVIYYFNEICNNDGVWVRLTAKSINEWCPDTVGLRRDLLPEAWVLQYHAHLERTFLLPIKSVENDHPSQSKENIRIMRVDRKCLLKVEPSRGAQSVGVLYPNETVIIITQKDLPDGEVWLKVKFEKKLNNRPSSSWLLLKDNQKIYASDISGGEKRIGETNQETDSLPLIPFDIASPSCKNPTETTISRQNEPIAKGLKDLINAVGESRANGNGKTPPRTPPPTPKKTQAKKRSPIDDVSRNRSTSHSPTSSPLYVLRKKSSNTTDGSSKIEKTNFCNASDILLPSLAECARTVFAAILLHEGIVHDAMTCATYLKFHTDLTKTDILKLSNLTDPDHETEYPATLRYTVGLWSKVSGHIYNVVKNHPEKVIIPCIPQSKAETSTNEKETVCELCLQVVERPPSSHMRQEHPGCGKPCGGFGFNSSGVYCNGWSGSCGEGGSGGSTWYLMCYQCFAKYLRDRTEKMDGEEKRVAVKPIPCILEQKTDLSFQEVIRRNANFLLQLSPSFSAATDVMDMTEAFITSNFSYVDASATKWQDKGQKLVKGLSRSQFGPTSGSLNEMEPQGFRSLRSPAQEKAIDSSNDPSILHRSISEATSNQEAINKSGRKRAQSTGVAYSSKDKIMIHQPSPALVKLFMNCQDNIDHDPVVIFVKSKQNVDLLEMACKQAIRKAACKVFALQAFDWLLKIATQSSCIHDVLWSFIAALSPIGENGSKLTPPPPGSFAGKNPVRDIEIAGLASGCVSRLLQRFLQDVADLITHLSPSSSIQMMAIRCFSIDFYQQDHAFLHKCRIFNRIDEILSKSESLGDLQNWRHHDAHHNSYVSNFIELKIESITVSSRPAMLSSLTDNSTETFWESGEEDKNKAVKTIIVFSESKINRALIYVDNVKDNCNRLAQATFYGNFSQSNIEKMLSTEVDNKFSGWIAANILPPCTSVKIDLKSVDATVRIRQVKILTEQVMTDITSSSMISLQQNLCENETLKIFRQLTSQVLGQLFKEKHSGDDSIDLRDHMLGILFSRPKLSQMQQEICAHIMRSIRKETEKLNCDTYCNELISMLLALSSSMVGRAYLSQQHNLIHDLLLLFHGFSGRVQKQILKLLKRVFYLLTPKAFAEVIKIRELPPDDFTSLLASENLLSQAPKLLDCLLSIVAKSLKVQYRVKGQGQRMAAKFVSFQECVEISDHEWWLKGHSDPSLSKETIIFIENLAKGAITEEWARITNACLAQSTLALMTATETDRNHEDYMKSSTFWLALAALSILQQEHAAKLTSSANRKTACDNHDDGETRAILECNTCGYLCADCDRFLHMSRKSRSHLRNVFKEEKESIRVDLHEGCRRIKLFWLMATADSSTGNVILEFRQHNLSTSGVCRFCSSPAAMSSAVGNVCDDQDCKRHAETACTKQLICGHMCQGVAEELDCPPCLSGCGGSKLKQDGDDMCMICFSEPLSAAPVLHLECGHVFHFHCCEEVLRKRWIGPRVTFGFILCPICKRRINHPKLLPLTKPIIELYQDVERKALMRLDYEGFDKKEMNDTKDVAIFAMNRYAYYVCSKCEKAYFGGEARCDEALHLNDDFNPEELVCGACSDVAMAQMCPRHGSDYLEYKCRYCCSVAVFFCFGTTHFCNMCHEDFQRLTGISKELLAKCPAGPKSIQLDGTDCPLKVEHPPTGQEYALGCGICRNAHTF